MVWPGGPDPEPVPEEEATLGRAVPTRVQEFRRGRWCARRALEALSLPSVPIPVGAQRQPLWPPGAVGAITHTRGWVMAAAARSSHWVGLGIDAERGEALDPAVAPLVLCPGEGGALDDLVIFSAKESVHKAVHPMSGAWLDFLDVRIEPGPGSGRFRMRPQDGVDPGIRALLGRGRGYWVRLGDLVITAVVITPGGT